MNPKSRFLSLLFIIGMLSLTTLNSQRVDASAAGAADDILKGARNVGGSFAAGGAFAENGAVVVGGLSLLGVSALGLWVLKGK